MKTSENQKSPREYKVYIHRLKTWVEVTEEQYYTYYRDIWATGTWIPSLPSPSATGCPKVR